MTDYTEHFHFEIPDFDVRPWHTQLENTIRRIDTVLYNTQYIDAAETWANDTEYVIGDLALDDADGSIWICQVDHTSASAPDVFADDRTANPTYWQAFAAVWQPQGLWANDTAYAVNDLVYDADLGIIAVCITAHVSSSAPDTILDDIANWNVICNFSWPADAADLSYDNSASGLAATNVQDAIDEVTTQQAAVTLTDAINVALDASLGKVFSLTAAGSRTISPPTNVQHDGQIIVIRHRASGGARTLSLSTSANGFRFTQDITALTSTASGKTDYITAIWNATDAKWDVTGYIKGA